MQNKIKQTLIEEELKSEGIAVLTQIAMMSILFLVYLFSPKGFEGSNVVGFEPVKLVFSIYLPILLVRALNVKIAKRMFLSHYLYLFIDILAITILIFSYHIQYQRPFSLSLHAPTFLYYYVFITLRCLSYDSKKVIVVGLFCSLAWIFMTIYAYRFSGLIRIHNFADYVQASSFILGAEIDKILSIICVTAICAVAVYRKGRLLEKFSQRNAYVSAMERLVGRETFKSMSDRNSELSPGMGTKRNAATMMIDLRGFSKLSYELAPEKIMRYLSEYHQIVANQVFKNGGSIDKYLGDGILVHFGAVSDQLDFAARALRAAEGINLDLNRWCLEKKKTGVLFDFGIAVCTGEVIFGAIGHEDRMEITVIGESVNLSAKLEKHTKATKFRILTTLKAFEIAQEQSFRPQLKSTALKQVGVEGIPKQIDLIGLGQSTV